MSSLDQFNQANQQAAASIEQLSAMFPSRSAGSLRCLLATMPARARKRLGVPGVVAAGLLQVISGLVLACLFMGGLLWATLGSFLLITSKTWLWGYPSNTMGGLGPALLTAFANAVLTLLALAYLYHLLMPRDARDVFGRKAFASERREVEQAGLSPQADGEGRS